MVDETCDVPGMSAGFIGRRDGDARPRTSLRAGHRAALLVVLGAAACSLAPASPPSASPLPGGYRFLRSLPVSSGHRFSSGPPWPVLPPDWDTATHGGLAQHDCANADVLPLIRIPIEGPNSCACARVSRRRPPWCRGRAPSPAMAMGPVITVTLVLIPVSLSFSRSRGPDLSHSQRWFPSSRSGLPSIVSGDRRPLSRIVDSTLIVPFVVAALRSFGVVSRVHRTPAVCHHASIW